MLYYTFMCFRCVYQRKKMRYSVVSDRNFKSSSEVTIKQKNFIKVSFLINAHKLIRALGRFLSNPPEPGAIKTHPEPSRDLSGSRNLLVTCLGYWSYPELYPKLIRNPGWWKKIQPTRDPIPVGSSGRVFQEVYKILFTGYDPM